MATTAYYPRTTFDRLRQSILFELLGFILAIPITLWIGGHSAFESGILTIMMSVTATVWNYLYNLIFDQLMIRLCKRVQKNARDRLIHAIGFEGTLLLATLPMIALWLDVSLMKALTLDLSLMVFYLIYTYVFTLCYDKLFPLQPMTNTQAKKSPV